MLGSLLIFGGSTITFLHIDSITFKTKDSFLLSQGSNCFSLFLMKLTRF